MEIKHLLSTNLTEDKANDRLDDTPFTTARLTPETRARFQEASQTAVKALIKTIKLPMLIGAYILLGLGLLVLSAFIKALPDAGLSTALRNAWWILLIGLALAAAGGILLAAHKRATNKQSDEESAEESSANRMLESVSSIVEMELGLPADDQMTEVEVLPFTYKIKPDGTVKEHLSEGCYSNVAIFLWREEDRLCLTDYDCVIKIPLSAVEGYYTVHEKYKISVWYKDEECTEEPYAAFDIKEDSDYNYRLSTYHRVMIRDGEERFEMRIPCYDLEAFKGLLDMPCLDEPA